MNPDRSLEELVQITLGKRAQSHSTAPLLRKYQDVVQRARLERVNQFAIDERFNGLEERWRISFEDDLADELTARLHSLRKLEIENQYQFLPECLQLILSLSTGQPTTNFSEKLSDVRSKADNDQILVDTSTLGNSHLFEDIWQDIDYTSPASDTDLEDYGELGHQQHSKADDKIITRSASSASLGDEKTKNICSAEQSSLYLEVEQIRHTTQIEAVADKERIVTEERLVKESICMLNGLKTDTYDESHSGKITVDSNLRIRDMTAPILKSLLESLAALGSKVNQAHAVVNLKTNLPVVRKYQENVQKHLASFWTLFIRLESDLMNPTIRHGTLLNLSIRTTRAFSSVEALLEHSKNFGFSVEERYKGGQTDRILEGFLDRIAGIECTEGSLDGVGAKALTDCLNECFETYWRPIRKWMVGENISCNDIDFLQQENENIVRAQQYWKHAYSLDSNQAPSFLRPFLKHVLVAGKTSVFLSKLTKNPTFGDSDSEQQFPLSPLIKPPQFPFENFQQRVNDELRSRCLEKTQSARAGLLQELTDNWQLMETFQSLRIIYLAEFGNLNDKAYKALFGLLDNGSKWTDRFLLTDIYQRAFDAHLATSIDFLTVTFEFDERTRHARGGSLVRLEAIKVKYTMSWPIANIVDTDSMTILQRVAVLLMQIARAKDCLDRYVCDRMVLSSNLRLGVLRISLEYRLRWFLNLLHSYISLNVLPAASKNLQAGIADAPDFDMLVDVFHESMEKLEHGCFLSASSESLYRAIVSLLDLTTVLAELHQQLPHDTEENEQNRYDRSIPPPKAYNAEVETGGKNSADVGKLIELHNTYRQLLSYVLSGIRESHRSTANPRLELFAKDLELELSLLRR